MNQPSTSATDRLQEAISLHQAKQYDRAAAICTQILAEQPRNSDALHILGLSRSEQRKPEEAIALLEQAISLQPNTAAYHHNLGGLNRRLGRMDRAAACFITAIRLKPDYGETYQALSEMAAFPDTLPPSNVQTSENQNSDTCRNTHRNEGDRNLQSPSTNQWLDRIEQQLAASQSPKNQSYLHFAAAKLCDRLQDYDRAFAHYQQGNQKAGVTCDLAAYRTLVTDNLYIFTSDFQNERPDWGVASDLPIFVVGMPRSGTTLVEHILATHPGVYGAGELPDIYSITQSLTSHFNPSPRYPLCMAIAPQEAIVGYANSYLARLTQIDGDAPSRVVDKHPLNLLYLGFIFTAFPNAKIIHLQRDARDTCLSCFQQNFTKGVTFSFDLLTLGTFYCFYERLMAHWSQYRPEQILHLNYESLTGDPESQIRRLLDFCGLDWDANCLNFHRTQRTVQTASANQVRQPLYRSSVGRWKRYEAHLEPLFNGLQWGDIVFDASPKPTSTEAPE